MTAAGGQRIADRYLLVSEIGAGGMGVVWKAHDTRLDRDVAVKLLSATAVSDPVARARLLREAKAAGSLQHDGIVRIHDAGESEDGSAFLVMELVAGSSLREALAAGTLSRREHVDIIVQIARALAAAHGAGVIHRDVKPENVLVRRDKRPVLLDFGLAKPIPSGFAETMDVGVAAHQITMKGSVVGTPAYLAPEQIRGGEVGAAADQFALGVTAFEMLTGRMPFQGSSMLEIFAAVLHQKPAFASKVSDVSEAVAEVLDRAMRREPSDRWPSISAFADALESAAAAAPSDGSIRAPSKPPAAALVTLPDVSSPDLPSVDLPPPHVASADTPPSDAPPSAPPPSHPPLAAPSPSLESLAPPPRRWKMLAGAAVVAAVVAVAGKMLVDREPRTSAPASSPSVSSASWGATLPVDAVVACPLFKVSGDGLEEPTGWLGAAAAGLACERAQDLLGGASNRALGPADLAVLPRDATDVGVTDPFSAPDIGGRIDAAAQEKTVRIVGAVVKQPGDYVVDVILRARDGRDVAHATGHGYELVEAVTAAIRGVAASFGSKEASPFQKEWLRVDSREAALDLRDLTSAVIIEDDVMLASICGRVAKRTDVRPEMLYLARAVCHERLKRASLDEAPPPIDESSPGALATTIAAQRARGGLEEVRKRVALLERAAQQTEETDERVILLATAAELLYTAGDASRSTAVSRAAVHASPKLVDLRGTPWHRLTFSSTVSHVALAHATWIPWEPVAVRNLPLGDNTTPYLARLSAIGRSALLGRRGYFMGAYCEHLTRAGRTLDAEGIADQLDSDMLRVRVLIGQAQYKAALARGSALLAAMPATDENAGTAFRLASSLAEAASFVGKPATFMDDVVTRFLDVEPPHVKMGVIPFVALVHACASAPPTTGKRCIRRLKQLYTRGDLGGVLITAPAMLDGADRWVAGDVEGAAKAWRPLAREAATIDMSLRHIMADAFDRAGMAELAARIDAETLSLVDQPGAMDPAFVRGARRAEKAGDRDMARKLATAALAKWQTADEDVPAARDMRALLARLGASAPR